MAEFPAPVVNAQTAFNPMQSLSNVLGIRQKMQDLQTGQYQQRSAQSKATIDTQNAKEIQSGAQLLQDPVGNGIIDSKGNPTQDGQRIIMQAMPTTGANHYSDIVNAAKTKVEFNRSVNNLSSDVRNEVGQVATGAASDPKASKEDSEAQMNAYVESKRGTPMYDDIKRVADTTMHIGDGAQKKQDDTGQIVPTGQEAWRSAHLGVGRTLLGAAGVVGAGGIANPQATSNAAGQTQNRNPITGDLSAPQLGPGASNPTSPQVAGQSSRQVGTAGSDINRGNEVSALTQPAKMGVTMTNEIDSMAEQVHSGKFAAYISKAAAAVGMKEDTYARQILDKDLGRLKALATAGAGSDERAGTILSGFPTSESDPQTIHSAMDVARGTFKQNLARSDLLNRVRTKDTSLQGFQHADDTLTSSSDPLMHEFSSLKSKEQRMGFYKRHFTDPAEAQDFRNKVAGMGHVLGN